MNIEVNSELSLEEQVKSILETTNLDFEIRKIKMFGLDNGCFVRSNDFGLKNSKTNEILSVVKAGYHVSQNEDIVRKVLSGMQDFGELKITQGGPINGGRKIVLQLAIFGESLVGGDTIKRYVTVLDSNDKSTGLSIGIGDKTMSCTNQFFHFYRSKSTKAKRFSLRHNSSLDEKMEEIPALITFALSESMRMMDLYREFQSTPCSKELAHDMVNHLIGIDNRMTAEELDEISTVKKNKMNKMYDNIYGEMDGHNSRLSETESLDYVPKGHNFWGMFSGITRYTSHELSVPRREFGREESQMIGGGSNMNHKALEFILDKSGIDFEFAYAE